LPGTYLAIGGKGSDLDASDRTGTDLSDATAGATGSGGKPTSELAATKRAIPRTPYLRDTATYLPR
jgi:hypothetical protein